jgi:hypothetical protein
VINDPTCPSFFVDCATFSDQNSNDNLIIRPFENISVVIQPDGNINECDHLAGIVVMPSGWMIKVTLSSSWMIYHLGG